MREFGKEIANSHTETVALVEERFSETHLQIEGVTETITASTSEVVEKLEERTEELQSAVTTLNTTVEQTTSEASGQLESISQVVERTEKKIESHCTTLANKMDETSQNARETKETSIETKNIVEETVERRKAPMQEVLSVKDTVGDMNDTVTDIRSSHDKSLKTAEETRMVTEKSAEQFQGVGGFVGSLGIKLHDYHDQACDERKDIHMDVKSTKELVQELHNDGKEVKRGIKRTKQEILGMRKRMKMPTIEIKRTIHDSSSDLKEAVADMSANFKLTTEASEKRMEKLEKMHKNMALKQNDHLAVSKSILSQIEHIKTNQRYRYLTQVADSSKMEDVIKGLSDLKDEIMERKDTQEKLAKILEDIFKSSNELHFCPFDGCKKAFEKKCQMIRHYRKLHDNTCYLRHEEKNYTTVHHYTENWQ